MKHSDYAKAVAALSRMKRVYDASKTADWPDERKTRIQGHVLAAVSALEAMIDLENGGENHDPA